MNLLIIHPVLHLGFVCYSALRFKFQTEKLNHQASKAGRYIKALKAFTELLCSMSSEWISDFSTSTGVTWRAHNLEMLTLRPASDSARLG